MFRSLSARYSLPPHVNSLPRHIIGLPVSVMIRQISPNTPRVSFSATAIFEKSLNIRQLRRRLQRSTFLSEIFSLPSCSLPVRSSFFFFTPILSGGFLFHLIWLPSPFFRSPLNIFLSLPSLSPRLLTRQQSNMSHSAKLYFRYDHPHAQSPPLSLQPNRLMLPFFFFLRF